jgi:hypothetical protein
MAMSDMSRRERSEAAAGALQVHKIRKECERNVVYLTLSPPALDIHFGAEKLKASGRGGGMSHHRGTCVVSWIERWGERFLKRAQSDIYDMLMLHVGGTDMLKRYAGTAVYWQNVQTVLDCFFTAVERAEMCAELIDEPLFADDPGFAHFLQQARAEMRCRELILMIETTAGIRASLRSVY